MKEPIEWSWVAEAIDDYVWCGYKYMEAPWIVSNEAVNATLPADAMGYKLFVPKEPVIEAIKTEYLAGSAEQGFIQMMLNGALDKGRYCAAGPCFRDDPDNDWYSRTFFKVELIDFRPESPDITTVVEDAKELMEYLGGCKLETLKTNTGIDLMCNGIEVGSYGYRQYKELKWIYGTGLALPRFSKAAGI